MSKSSISLVFGLLVACTSAAWAQAAPPVSFLAARTSPVGSNPISVVTGDFNGDGKADLAVTNYQDNDISVLVGNGDGTFQTAVTYATGTNPSAIAVGDFNGDGKLDLAVVNNADDDVSILLGNGDGTFQASVNYSTGSGPVSVVVTDFNGDGKADLAVANNSDDTVSVLLGNGDGTFQLAVNYSAGNTPSSVVAGDANGDGKLDLIVANFNGNNVSVLLGVGDGSFQPAVNYGTAINPQSVTLGDFNGDGKPDLAVVNACANSNCPNGSVSVLLGNGDGTFQVAVNYGAGSGSLSASVADFNGDGNPDLAVVNRDDNDVSVFLGNGDGTFQAAVNYGDSANPSSIAAGDFNGDGKIDVAVTNYGSNDVAVLLGKGDGTFPVAPKYHAGAVLQSVAVADFNGDGKPDLVTADSNSNDVGVLLGNGDGTFAAAATYGTGKFPISVAVGDLNGDGKPDLVSANFSVNSVSVLLGVGDGTFITAVNYDAGSEPESVAVGDFNADGKTDLAVADFGGSISVLLGNGDGTFQGAISYAAGSGPRSVAVGDFNGDGNADLAVADGSGALNVLLGNGDGTFQSAVSYVVGAISYSVTVGDFNGDGKPDLVLASSGNVSVLLGNGDGTFQAAIVYPAGLDPRSVTVGDFNGDGKADLAVANDAGSSVSVLLGNGDGTFQAAVSFGTGSQPLSVAAGDFNGDGRLDLVLANFGSGDLSILLNTTPFSGASIISPVPNSTLSGSTTTFQWSAGTGATAYWIDVGNVAGGNQYYQSGSLSAHTRSATVNSLPVDGSTVYVTMYSLIAGQWVNKAYTYTAYNTSSDKGVITSPVANSTLSGSTVTFQWSAGTSATAYWIDIGSVVGGNQYYQSGSLSSSTLQATVNGLPINGSTVYATLYALIAGQWVSNAYSYTAYSNAANQGIITSPASGSTLSGSSVTFQWSAGASTTAYWLDVGNAEGGNQFYQSGSLSSSTLQVTVSGLPTNGSAVYATLYSLVAGQWLSNAYTYTAFNLGSNKGVLTSPVPGSTLSGSSVAFAWTAGTNATAYWLDLGNVVGGNQYYQSGNLGNILSVTVNSLPTNGTAVYATLYSLINGQWLSNGYTYMAVSGVSAAVLTNPAPGSTLRGSSVTFSWTAGTGASAYWLDVGAVAGGNQYYQSGNLGTALTTIVNSLPADGSTVYATLYSLLSGQWVANSYTYTSSTLVATTAVLTTPAPGTTLAGSGVSFSWTPGSGATAYWLDIGAAAGGNQYYQSGNLGNVLTTTANGLPTNGTTIYVTLYSLIGGQWLSNAYTFTTLVTYPGSTFFVAPNGNDSWNGDLSAPNSNNSDGPFASLSRAQYAIEHAAKPATVIVRGGTYYPVLTPAGANSHQGTLKFTSADSGTSSSAEVTWQNYPGETPVVSGGVPANADPISGAGLQLQWTNSGNVYQAPLPATLANGAQLQPFEYLYYNGQRRLRSRIHDNGTTQYPSIGYFMRNGQCVATPSTPAGQQSPTLAACNLGTFLRVANTISPGDTKLGTGCPSAAGIVNNLQVSKCLDRFVYSNTSGGDPIQAWQNLNGSYTGNAMTPCAPNATAYPAGDIELTLIDAWTVDVMRVGCVDTADNVIFLLGATKGGGTNVFKDANYNYLGPTVGHRYIIENTLDAFNDALTPSSSQYGLTGIWFLDRHTTPWVLNYIANQNENPATDNIVIPQLGAAIPGSPATDYIGGSLISATNLSYVNFQGITFEVDNFYPDGKGFNNDVNGEMSLPQAIDCENCQFVTFNTVTVRHTSASGILAGASAATPACSGNSTPSCVVIESSSFYDIGDSAIRVGHTPAATDTSATVIQGVMANNNLIQGYSRVFADGEGIAEGNGNNNQYVYNTITDGYHAGISICKDGCGPTAGGVSVSGNNIATSYNLISNVMQGITSDGGAVFYNIGNSATSGTGNSILGNVINNVTDSFIIDNPTTAGITVAGSAYGGEGIYLDGQSAGVQVTNNVVYNLSGHGIHIAEGLASAAQTQNIFNNNIFAFANLGIFVQTLPWPNGCPSTPIKQVDVTNNVFYFDRLSTSSPSFLAVGGCFDSCGQAYNTYQNFQGNSYWRTDGQFAADRRAFQVLTTQGLNSNNSCKSSPTTLLYFNNQTSASWQNGGTGVPVAMNEETSPAGTALYQPPFTASGLANDPPSAYSFTNGQTPPTPFAPGGTNLTITNAHSSLPQQGSVPATFPTYIYGSSLNKF